MNYPLMKNKYAPKKLYPINSSYSDEYARDHCRLYLSTEYVEDNWGKIHKYYRLHASEPHTIEMALEYEITCPNCGRQTLRQIGRSLNMHDLGLYHCPCCDRKK